MLVYYSMEMIAKKDLTGRLLQEGIPLKPNTIRYYEVEGLIPSPISRGLGRGKGKLSHYPKVVIDIIRDIKQLKSQGMSLRLIKFELSNRYREWYHTEDIKKIMSLRFYNRDLLETYCQTWGISLNDIDVKMSLSNTQTNKYINEQI